MQISYEELREWRDICEYLDKAWYKFLEDETTRPYFSLLTESGRDHRQALWSLWMIQFVEFGAHPYTFYHKSSRSERQIRGWRLLPNWEIKIDFLEQIILFGRNSDDLPQPWKQEIWAAFFKKREKEIEQQRLYEEWRRRDQERMDRFHRKQLEAEEKLKAGIARWAYLAGL